MSWSFSDETGTFTLSNPHQKNYIYFPLVNEAGMMSSLSPMLHGDIKTGHNSFLTIPVSVEDLHNSRSGRNFWFYLDGFGPWSVGGASARQRVGMYEPSQADQVRLEAGILWHKLTRVNLKAGIQVETINFIPANRDRVELMQVAVTNIGRQALRFTPTAAVPIYGRSADNLRDHRHVTSLLHRIWTESFGVFVKPTMSFDERGHTINTITYAVLGVEEEGISPVGFFPVVSDYIGDGGTLEWPEAIIKKSDKLAPAGYKAAGYEALGGLRFNTHVLEPGKSRSYILIMSVLNDSDDPNELVTRYGGRERFQYWLDDNKAFWQKKISGLIFKTANIRFDGWLKWVAVQPILRRLFGNSFLPYHDYGRGGRGWRDLWQDTLVQLMMEPDGVDDLLWNYYAGVRMDGSNATIIGSRPGEFKADRNDIPRVWMDHGAWPWLTTKRYIDQSGDLDFLLRNQVYFKDRHVDRCHSHDKDWHDGLGTQVRDDRGDVYQGSILEHLLVQHLTAFFNVGEHNNIRLEGGDWNDGMDMASKRGESVAFTALYANNLHQISQLVMILPDSGVSELEVSAELLLLLDTISGPVNYNSVADKQDKLATYFASCRNKVSGEKVAIPARDLARDLEVKADWLVKHIRKNEWIQDQEGNGWFNGYYDNNGNRVEGLDGDIVRMTLTGQVFTMMGGIADEKQIQAMVQAADRYLWEESIGGYRLNTDFKEVLTNLGRFSGFAFGHKENGAMFSHMAMMWANALFQRGLVCEGLKVIDTLYMHCQNFAESNIYPGVPEYIDPRGRGMYPYLTGSASWLLLTMLTELFGVKGQLGDLVLEPKLMHKLFDADGKASVSTQFAGRQLTITYLNPEQLDYGMYVIRAMRIDGKEFPIIQNNGLTILARDEIQALSQDRMHDIAVELGASLS
ncbi:MAG TPA: cellobiose phosphorylase [Anaerolineales bacterium]|nr:cellobiose phosphorylase [Anaerolineales bacterium]